MCTIRILAVIFFMIVLPSQTEIFSQSDEIEKSELLNAMNNLDGIDLSPDKKDRLKESNSNAVDNLFDISRGDYSDDEKINLFKKAKEDNLKMFEDVLGKDDFKKYKKHLKKQLKPFKRRAKLVGFLI